jgi:hypothetical protein
MGAHNADSTLVQSEADLVRARLKAIGLDTIYAAFPSDVLTAMEQADRYNKSISEQKLPLEFLGTMVLPEPNP